MSLTPDQRRSLDGEHKGVESKAFSTFGIPPEPIAQSKYDPGICNHVDKTGWRCGLTAYHGPDHYFDRPPGFEMES